MFDIAGIKFESIKLRIGSLMGSLFSYRKVEHNKKTISLKLQKTENIGTRIEQQQISQQVILNLPGGLPLADQKKFIKELVGAESTQIEEGSVSPETLSVELLPIETTNLPAENFLERRYQDYSYNNNLLLERGGLFYIYKNREHFSYSKEKLIFLTQSSLENDFPTWFWLFTHREKFESAVPLLQKTFEHHSRKIRKRVVDLLNDFTDTSEEIITLMQNEANPEVIGYAISKFLAKKDYDRSQRIIANALTRKITPILTEEYKKRVKKLKIDLGAAERRFLHNEVESGWQNEKFEALTILSLSAEESDLPFLETTLTQASYTNVINLVLTCIAQIGKTNKSEYIEKELLKTTTEETFIAHLNALVGTKYYAIFPKLLEWLGDIDSVTSKFWSKRITNEELGEEIQKAIGNLLTKNTYELLVQYILANYSSDTERGNIMSWRHFWVLRELKNNPEVTSLLKTETRLEKFKSWNEVAIQLEINESQIVTDAGPLLSTITPQKSRKALLILRKLYKTFTPEEAVKHVAPLITIFRKNLITRLNIIASGEHPEEVKTLSKNDLEKFLGENRTFYRLNRLRKKGNRYELEGPEDVMFETLSEDIDNFSSIETEYFKHIFKTKIPDIQSILLNSIGRPYDSIYDSIDKDSGNTTQLGDTLLKLLKDSPNPLIRLKAIEALLRLDISNISELHAAVLTILLEARDSTKTFKITSKESDHWFVSEITYLCAINSLTEFGIVDDFKYIREATNRENILTKSYYRYTHFFDDTVIEELLALTANLQDQTERENALAALDSLDYKWTRKILKIEN